MLKILLTLCALFGATQAANAACNPATRPGGVPFNCDPGNVPASGDLFLGGSNTGSNAGQTVSFTGGQLIAMDHSLAPVTSLAGTSGNVQISPVTKTLASWVFQIQSLAVTPTLIGGQTIYPGGTTNNQGNGPLIALATGTFVSGNCRQTDANGNEVDSGAACGGGGTGGGGSGTVTSGIAGQLAYYSASGTTVAGLSPTTNSVLTSNASNVAAFTTTLPTGLAIPSPTISAPTITGTGTDQALTGSGKLTTTATTATAAGLNLPPGTAPTAPVNGDVWTTSAGLYARVNGATVGPFGTGGGTSGLTSVTATAPLAGSGTTGAPLTCVTCVTSTNGGALTATAPMSVSASGLIALGAQPGAALVQWPSSVTVTADTYYFALSWPWASGTINKISYATGGTTPSFTVTIQVNGTSVTGCTGLTVTSATVGSATCTAANTVTTGQPVTLVVSGVSGTPDAAQVQISYTRSAS